MSKLIKASREKVRNAESLTEKREETLSELCAVFWFFIQDMHRKDKQTQCIFIILVLPMLKANLVVQIFLLSIYKCLRSYKIVYICGCKQYISFSFKRMTKFSISVQIYLSFHS